MKNIYGLGDYSTEQIRELVKDVQKENLDPSDIYLRRPDATGNPEEMITSMPIAEVVSIIPDAFAGDKGARLARFFSLKQLEEIGKNGDAFLKTAIKISLATAGENNEHVKVLRDYTDYSPMWQI